MNSNFNDFEKFAVSKGIGTNKLNGYNNYATKNGIIEPYILEERQLNVASLSVFSRLMYDRIIFLGTAIDSDVANIINAQLLYLNSIGDDNVKIFINSPGGQVTSGLAILDTMNFIEPNVETYCMGLAASMGSVILSGGTRGMRHSLPHGEILIHQPLGGAEGQASDILIQAEQIKKCKDELFKILSENTGQSIEQIWKDADRDFWMTPEEAKSYGKYGLIDEIITKTKN